MAFWSERTAEPKRKFRWLLHLTPISRWYIKSVNKPNWTADEAEHQYLNHTFYFPGRVKFNTIKVTLVDPASPDAAATLNQILGQMGYVFPDNATSITTISKSQSIVTLGDVIIEQIDAAGNTQEEFKLINAWIKNVDFGSLDYNDNGLVEITLEIRFDGFNFTSPGQIDPVTP
jgi:hypothetical protein